MALDQTTGAEKECSDNFPVGMRVLAVDDDPICLRLLETLLRKCDYDVTTTNSATTALKLLRGNKRQYDLVISDVHMPDMDGFKLLELVGLEMDLPVIMLSANSDTKVVLKGITHGACDYLVKPVRIEELRNIWQHVVRRKNADSKNQSKSGDEESALGEQLSGSTERNETLIKRRMDEEDASDTRVENVQDPATQKKPRVIWCAELHKKFVAAVSHLGIENAVPKKILELMNVEGLARENVASHLQKYRQYLKRISSIQQEVSMLNAFSGNGSFMQMASQDGFGDLQTLALPGQFSRATLSPSYSSGYLLGRPNSSGGLSSQNLNSMGLFQPIHAQSSVNSIAHLGTLNSGAQTAMLNSSSSSYLGVPSLETNPQFTGSGSAVGSSVNAMIGFGNPNPLNMNSLRSEPLNIGGSNGNLQSSIPVANSYPLMKTLTQNQFGQNLRGNYSSTAFGSMGQAQYQGIFAGNAIQGVNQVHGRPWGQHEQNQNSNNVLDNSNAQIPANNTVVPTLSQLVDQNNGFFNGPIDAPLIGQPNEGSSALIQNNVNGNLNVDSGITSGEDNMLKSTKTETYDTLDDLMDALVKQGEKGDLFDGDFGYDPNVFGSSI